MVRTTLGLLAGLLLLVLALPTAPAQVQSCGEGFELFIRNPDIVPDDEGIFHVSGRLLVQFQVIGERADEIEAFALSFGADLPTGEEVCDLPPYFWLTGAYIEGYSADYDKSDGFFIAINSNGQTSPQADLGVAVHGYDANGNELARFWGIVRLDHCAGQPSLGCPDNEDAPDFTMPWPILLPGDGLSPDSFRERFGFDGFSFEFNERLADDGLRAELNGEDVTHELEEWTDRPEWDQDSFPDSGPSGIFQQVAPPCTLPSPLHECGPLYGPAYKWTQRALTDDDVVRIIATDLAGNVATKEIHVGSAIAGGTIADGLPILQMTFRDSTVGVPAGETAVFQMRMQNNGGGEGHPFARATVPTGWDYEWVPGHRPVPAGGSSLQELLVHVPADAEPGRYPVRAIIDYRQGAQDRTLESALFVEVHMPQRQIPVDDAGEDTKRAPAGPALAALALIGALAAALRGPPRRSA